MIPGQRIVPDFVLGIRDVIVPLREVRPLVVTRAMTDEIPISAEKMKGEREGGRERWEKEI
jgi:hypothetical protein